MLIYKLWVLSCNLPDEYEYQPRIETAAPCINQTWGKKQKATYRVLFPLPHVVNVLINNYKDLDTSSLILINRHADYSF